MTRCFALALATLFLVLAPAGPSRAAGPAPRLHVVARIPGPDGGWDYASFDAAQHRVYVAHGDVVIAIDADTDRANNAFARGDHLHAIVPVPGTDLLVTTNSGDDTARILSATNGRQLASIPTAQDADGASYDPKTGLVVVVCGDGGALTLIDPRAKTSVGTITVGDRLESGAPDGKGNFFVNVASTNQVAMINLETRKVVTRFALSDCNRPTGLVYVSGDRVISACADGGVNILDARTGRIVARFKVGGFPDQLIYDPRRELAFAPSAFAGTLSVIALSGKADNTIIATVPTQIGARTGAVDPQNGKVFLPTAQYNLPVPAGQRPTTKPGTFVVLVLAR